MGPHEYGACKNLYLFYQMNCKIYLLERDFMRRMVEPLKGEGKREPTSSSFIYYYLSF
jgi:hypothetical protein